MCTVANFKHYGSKAALDRAFGDRWLYIGRANGYAQLEASPLANPFKVRQYGRGGTLGHYRRWLWEQIQTENQEVLAALRSITESSVLVCWCDPLPCHGDVVKAAAAWLRSQQS